MSAERRLIVLLGGIAAAVSFAHAEAPASFAVPDGALLGAMIAVVAVQIALLVRVRRRGDCGTGCRPIRQRFRA